MEFLDCLPAIRANRPELADRNAGFTSLEHVLNWLTGDNYALHQIDMITQDEFCHDLLIPLLDTGNILVFGMT
jgi:hypothetical protein